MREFCFKHQLLRNAGEQCGLCAIETVRPCDVCAMPVKEGAFCHGWLNGRYDNRHIVQPDGAVAPQRDTLTILTEIVADHDATIAGLQRQLNALQHRLNDVQRACNAGWWDLHDNPPAAPNKAHQE